MAAPSFSLQNQVAIISGGRRGIGKAMALKFAEAGADIVICDLVSGDELEKTAEELRKSGRRVLAIPADVTKRPDVENVHQKTMNQFGHIDILANCAGNQIIKPFLETTEEDWDSIMDTHLKGHYQCCQVVAKTMVEQKKGCIINMGSVSGIGAVDKHSAYCAAKAGIMMFTRVLARELAPYNIRVNSIAPSLIKTDLMTPWLTEEEFQKRDAAVPMGRMTSVDDIANIALILASDTANWITGNFIRADGALWA